MAIAGVAPTSPTFSRRIKGRLQTIPGKQTMCYSVMVEQDLKKLEQRFGAQVDQSAFADFEQHSLAHPKAFKPLTARIYPNYFAPIITAAPGGGRLITPMRYRVRPAGSASEVPSKYNMFNARLDGLTTRLTWRQLFMRQHGILVFKAFFEWVTDEITGKKTVLAFSPDGRDLMWAPVLFDIWRSPDGKDDLRSFAIITSDPPPEILAKGHDRCPIFLAERHLEDWLHPERHAAEAMLARLTEQEPATFTARAA